MAQFQLLTNVISKDLNTKEMEKTVLVNRVDALVWLCRKTMHELFTMEYEFTCRNLAPALF